MNARGIALVMALCSVAVISLSGCQATAPDVAGVYRGVPDLPDDFLVGLKHAIDHRRAMWEADWSVDTLELESVQYLGDRYRWQTSPHHEATYLVLVTVEDEDGLLPILALITERPDLDNPARFQSRMAHRVNREHLAGNAVMLTGFQIHAGAQTQLVALGGWVSRQDVAAFDIKLSRVRELSLDGHEHRFFVASYVLSSRAYLGWREITAYDGEGNVLWQDLRAPEPDPRRGWGIALAGVLAAAGLVALALFLARRPQAQEVRRMPDSAFFEDRTHSMGYRHVIGPVVGMLVVLAGGLWGTVVTWPVEVGADMERVAVQELREIESVERIFAVRGGGVTVSVVGQSEDGILVTERLVIDPQTLELVSRGSVVVRSDPYGPTLVLAWVSRLLVMAAVLGLVRYRAIRIRRQGGQDPLSQDSDQATVDIS